MTEHFQAVSKSTPTLHDIVFSFDKFRQLEQSCLDDEPGNVAEYEFSHSMAVEIANIAMYKHAQGKNPEKYLRKQSRKLVGLDRMYLGITTTNLPDSTNLSRGEVILWGNFYDRLIESRTVAEQQAVADIAEEAMSIQGSMFSSPGSLDGTRARANSVSMPVVRRSKDYGVRLFIDTELYNHLLRSVSYGLSILNSIDAPIVIVGSRVS